MTDKISIRKARMEDIKAIHSLLLGSAEQGQLLARSLNDLYGRVRDFTIAVREADNSFVGCCALAPAWLDIAEIRSLAVCEDFRGLGAGRLLVEACLSEAVLLGAYRIFVLTYLPDFFNKFFFQQVEKSALPQKIWADCLNCPQFPDCDEIALLLEI